MPRQLLAREDDVPLADRVGGGVRAGGSGRLMLASLLRTSGVYRREMATRTMAWPE